MDYLKDDEVQQYGQRAGAFAYASRQEETRVRAEPDSGNAESDRERDQRANVHARKAWRLEAVEKHSRDKPYSRVAYHADNEGVGWSMEYAALISKAAQAKRLVTLNSDNEPMDSDSSTDFIHP
jgi:hypothetical protein